MAIEDVKTFHSKIVGVSKRNADGSDRQRLIARCRVNDKLRLVREPRNTYDKNAIAVRTMRGEQLGYLSADLASDYAAYLDAGGNLDVTISDLTGHEAGKESRGVNLLISETGGASSPKDKTAGVGLAAASMFILGVVLVCLSAGEKQINLFLAVAGSVLVMMGAIAGLRGQSGKDGSK